MRHEWEIKQSNHGIYDLVPLKNRIHEMYGSYGRLAKAVYLTKEQVCNLANGKCPFRQGTIDDFARALQIPYTKIGYYFFRKKKGETT